MSERFEHLEGPHGLPDKVKEALKKLDRFEHLEIAPSGQFSDINGTGPARKSAPPPKENQRLCPRCAQANEKERETCWACFKPLDAAKAAAAKPQDITLVLDGKTYRSTDKDLPDDVSMLMKRIQAEGYSEGLLAEWRSWRATRRSPPPQASRPFDERQTRGEDPERDIKVFKGQRVSVIRLDGKVYTSDDPGLSEEMKALFAYIEREGVTPELMETLRQNGDAKFRPPTTALPSDGDVEFWKDVGRGQQAEPDAGTQISSNLTMTFLVAATALWLLMRLMSCSR